MRVSHGHLFDTLPTTVEGVETHDWKKFQHKEENAYSLTSGGILQSNFGVLDVPSTCHMHVIKSTKAWLPNYSFVQ